MQGGHDKRAAQASTSRAGSYWRSRAKPVRDFEDTADPAIEVARPAAKPARVLSWRASSHDLRVGATVTEVTDTIPGELFDELFNGGH
jgi:hypothetical protein